MSVEQKIKVMQAYADGKKIQAKSKGYSNLGWSDFYDDEPLWNWSDYEYRIKPEEEYRPYTSVEEMVEDYCSRATVCCHKMALPYIWVRTKCLVPKKCNFFISMYDESTNEVRIADLLYDIEELFEKFEYLDGSPVGKKIE